MSAVEFSFPVHDLFPKEGRQKLGKKNPALKAIYLITDGKKNHLKDLKRLKDCETPEPKFGLTALSVAVMMQDHDALKYLLFEKKVNPNPIDKSGFTPLLYACAIGDKYSISELQKALPQETQKMKTVTQDIFQLFPGWKSMLEKPPLENKNDLFKQTNGHYCDALISDHENFCLLLKERLMAQPLNPAETLFNDELVRQFEKRENESELLYLGPQEGADLGVIAKKDINGGQIIGIYGGKLNLKNDLKNGDALLNHIDSSELRNLVNMVNDGFPNATILPVYLPDGRVYHCLIALCDIEKGKGIFINYPFSHKVKTCERKELNLDEMEKYFKENRISQLRQFVRDNASPSIENVDLMIKLQEIAAHLRYLFQTPSALISLFLKGIIKTSDLQLLQEEPFLLYLEIQRFDSLRNFLGVSRDRLLAYDGLRKSKNSSIFFPDLEKMGFTILEKYSARVFLNIIHLIIRNEEKMAKHWKSQKKNIRHTAKALNLIYSRFVEPQKEKIDESYLKKCQKAIQNLPLFYQSYIKESCHVIFGLEKEFSSLFKPTS